MRRRVPLRLCDCLELIVMLCQLLRKLHSPIAPSFLPVEQFERGHILIVDRRLLSLQGDARIQAADHAKMQIRYCVFVDDVLCGCMTRSVERRVRACNQRVVRLAISNNQHVKHVVEFMKVWNQKKMKISLKRGILPSAWALKNSGVTRLCKSRN